MRSGSRVGAPGLEEEEVHIEWKDGDHVHHIESVLDEVPLVRGPGHPGQ